jgi:hypothetical protein
MACVTLVFTPDKFFSKNYKRTDLTRYLREDLKAKNENNFDYEFWKKNL